MTYVEGIHDLDRVVQFLFRCGLETGEAVHSHDFDSGAERVTAVGQPGFEHVLGTTGDHVQQAGGPGPFTDRGQINDHRDEVVPTPGVSPHVLVDSDDFDPVEAVGIIDEAGEAFHQDGGVGGTPGHAQGSGDPGDGHFVDDDGVESPG